MQLSAISSRAYDDSVEDSLEAGQESRDRVVAAALALLARDGREALTTRAVAAAAGIQAPTIYRLFGDKQGLVDAVAEHGFASYLAQKRIDGPSDDPVENLRSGWDLHVEFGVGNPAIFVAMYGDPRAGKTSPAAARALEMLRTRMRSLALAGRLRVEERRAADMVRAAACGVVFILLETAEAERDPGLSVSAREAVIDAITTEAPQPRGLDAASVATTLRALLPELDVLTQGERGLLAEWLDRLARREAG